MRTTTHTPRTIVIVGGYWSSNIGNSFFQLGAKYLLEQVFPNDRVIMLSDQPGFWNVKMGNPRNAFILLEHIQIDFLVILGPFLRMEYERIWSKTLRNLSRKGVKIIVLGAGMMRYSQEETEHCRKLLAETPLHIFTSRDSETYDHFHDLAEHSYNGIDVAFFASDFFTPVPVDLDKYVVFNFDQIPEPRTNISKNQGGRQGFEFRGEWWEFKFPPFQLAMSRRFRVFPFVDAFLPGKRGVDRMGDCLIIRTDHRSNPILLRKVHRYANSFVSDIPYTYLNLYANAVATFTNRVHACVAALAFGKAAMLFSRTPRVRLLEKLGLTDITRKPVFLSAERLELEKAGLTKFLVESIE